MKNILWIITCQREISTALSRELAQLRKQISRPFGWCVSTELAENEQAPLPLAKISVAVLVVDRKALLSKAYVKVTKLLIATMADRDDFCVFPWLRDVSVTELQELAERGNPLAIELFDNIHLDPSMESLEDLKGTIRRYLDNLETLRAFSQFSRFSLGFTQMLGKASEVFSWGLVLVALVVSVIVLMRLFTGIPPLQGLFRDVSAILVWAAVLILGFRFLNLLRFLIHNPEMKRNYSRIGPDYLLTGGGGFVLSLAGAFLEKGQGIETLGIGFGIGLMVVSLVRKGRRAHIHSLSFAELPEEIEKGTILSRLHEDMAENIFNSGKPLYESPLKRVFISYSRSSAWSSTVAEQIAVSLRGLGAYVFLDRPSLRLGFSWKRQLRWAIDNSNVFITVLDQVAARREWIAAEFITAFRNKTLKWTPEIFVVHPKEMDFSKVDKQALNIFAELLVRPSRSIPERMRSKLITYDTESCNTMCDAIKTYPIAGEFGILVNIAFSLVVGILVFFISLACNLGLPLMLFHLLSIQGIISPASLLATHVEMATPVASVLALLGGFSLRNAVRSFAEIRRSDYAYTPGYLELLEASAFFVGAIFCVPWLSLKGVCISVLMVLFGLELGNIFTVSMRTWKSLST
ncbi:toll/interleukin-1 receptor domain-containing protein [Candidatus Latescibacterota bacterium]